MNPASISLFIFLLGMCLLWYLFKNCRPIPILLYHYINGEVKKSGLSVSLSAFERQIQYVIKNDIRVISPDELLDRLRKKGVVSDRMVVLTFDDGDQAFYTKVYPLLVKYQIPAVVFVIIEWIDRPGYLSWNDLHSMSSELVTVGSHSMSHRYLPDLDLDEVRRELIQSKANLEHQFGRPIKYLSYPVGGYNADIRRVAMEAGYSAAFTTNRGRNFRQKDHWTLRRIKMTEKSTSRWVLAAKLSGFYDLFKSLFPKDPHRPKADRNVIR